MIKRISFVFIALFSFLNALAQNPDIRLLQKLNAPFSNHEERWIDISNSVYWIPPVYLVSNLAYGIAANNREARRYGLEAGISTVISMAITGGLKYIVDRPRPAQAYPELIRTYSFTDGKSFPSGHTSLAFATATTMAYQAQRWYVSVPVFTWSTTIGYSRMRLGKHYPTDVLVGTIIGLGGGILGHWVTNKIVR